MPDRYIVRLSDVTRQYQSGVVAGVKQINLEVERGRILTVVGESGSGKTTLLKLIYGLLAPDSGTVFYNDEIIQGPHEKLIPGHDRMKLVAQDFNLNQFSKVYDNIAGMLSNLDLQAKRRKTLEVMEFLRIDQLADKRAADLSGGEQQRVAIARAVITDPAVLLLDEPFSQVDALLKNQLRADIKRLAEFMGITIILVSHDPADGLSLADKMIILKEGKILETGPPQELYNNPRYMHTARLLSNCNVLTPDEALLAGITSEKDTVVIYPEWIETGDEGGENIFQVRDLFFKGFYSELLLKKEYLQLRALNIHTNRYKRGDRLSVVIRKYLEFDH